MATKTVRLFSGAVIKTPRRRIPSGCCARAATGHAAAPPTSVMNSRRFINCPAPDAPTRA